MENREATTNACVTVKYGPQFELIARYVTLTDLEYLLRPVSQNSPGGRNADDHDSFCSDVVSRLFAPVSVDDEMTTSDGIDPQDVLELYRRNKDAFRVKPQVNEVCIVMLSLL